MFDKDMGMLGMLGGGMLGGGLANLFGFGQKDPFKEANKHYGQIPGMMKPYYDPYIQAGQRQIPGLEDEYSKMMQNPGDIISRLGSGYQQSPGFQFQLGEGQRGINNAAAAGGMAGTPMHQQQAGQMANNLANQDFQQYLQQAMGMYGGGLSGRQGLMNNGMQMGQSLADNLAAVMMNQGNLAAQSAINRNQQNQQGLGGLFGGLGALGGFFGS